MAFDMRVIGIRRDPCAGAGHADAVHAVSELHALLPQADFVALTCPLKRSRDGSQGRRARRLGRAAAARGMAAVGHGARAHHATYRRRDRRYEDDVLAIMQENLARLWRGETELLNQVV